MQSAENYIITTKETQNGFSVNRKLVNSYDYHRKFDNITTHKAANESIYQQSKRILENQDGTEYERMVVVDYRTGSVVADNIESTVNNKLKTGFTEEQYQKVINHKGNTVIIHNHPGSTRPSGKDILTLWNT